MSKPAIVLVTGSFAPPGLYDNVVTDLRAKGYEVSNPQLETVGKKPGAATTMYDDAALIAGEAEKFADQGKDVVLIAHSYGGTPATESVKGLSKADREKAGKKGGIVRIGYMSTLVPVIGMSAAATMEGANSEMMIPDADGWLHQTDFAKVAQIVFNHFSPEEGQEWAKKFSQHSAISFTNELTYAGYMDVPSSWMFCEDDMTVNPENQQKGIDRIEAATGKKVDVTRGHWDHCPTVTHFGDSIKWIVSVAEKGGKWE